MDYSSMSPRDVRQLIREGKITCNTSGMCAGYAQANLCVLPKDLAYDFLLFAQRNPRPCPILEVSDVGSRFLKKIAPGADIANDIPKYRVYENGVMTGEYTSVEHLWRDDFVSFLIGCSFSFESELIAANVPIRHIEEGRNVPMYLTNIECEPAGIFHGKMVVSMRPLPYDKIGDRRHAESPRRPDSYRRPVRYRYKRYLKARFRRCGYYKSRRSARILAVRRHSAVGSDEHEAAHRDNPFARTYAHNRCQKCRA